MRFTFSMCLGWDIYVFILDEGESDVGYGMDRLDRDVL